jgi:glyoxylase-like metal-dependent hydrolase (beta-lactamase superfamily II)
MKKYKIFIVIIFIIFMGTNVSFAQIDDLDTLKLSEDLILQKTVLKPPNHSFKINDGLKFEIGNEMVEIYYPGPGHTQDNIVVYFHQRKMLFAGCIVKALRWKGLGFTGDADLKEWSNSLKKLLDKFPQSRIVIPGHGSYGDLSLIHHTLKLLRNKNF